MAGWVSKWNAKYAVEGRLLDRFRKEAMEAVELVGKVYPEAVISQVSLVITWDGYGIAAGHAGGRDGAGNFADYALLIGEGLNDVDRIDYANGGRRAKPGPGEGELIYPIQPSKTGGQRIGCAWVAKSVAPELIK